MKETKQLGISVTQRWLDEIELIAEQIGVTKEDIIRLTVADWVNQRKLEFAERGIYLEKK